MRIRILHIPHSSRIDGIRLEQFVEGHQYEVGNQLGALFLCEGWAEPVDDPSPALVIPLREFGVDLPTPAPSNLRRETYPPDVDDPPAAALDRRRRSRHRSS